MQIDFHHGTTYVCARLAGFPAHEAKTIAHAAQYVDDATSEGFVQFDNGSMYRRIASANTTTDKDNLDNKDNHLIWLPFHFLPGNEHLAHDQNPDSDFFDKIVCRPNSFVARDMLVQTVNEKDRPYALHRLGIAMHVYADTWAHQGFAGTLGKVNDVEQLQDIDNTGSGIFDSLLDNLTEAVWENAIPALGHGQAGVFPDMPFLHWQYENGKKEIVKRDNPKDFLDAAAHLVNAMKIYREKDAPTVEDFVLTNPTDAIPEAALNSIGKLFNEARHEEGEERHKTWLEAIHNEAFVFPNTTAEDRNIDQTLTYIGSGKGSWKNTALGKYASSNGYSYSNSFLSSDWKMFHDAVQAHRFKVIHDILPKYNICAA